MSERIEQGASGDRACRIFLTASEKASCRISLKSARFQSKTGVFLMILTVFVDRLVMLLRRINLPVILLSYHFFLHFSVNFLSHNQAVKFDMKTARKHVLVLILSHNLSHKSPRQPPLFLITRAFLIRAIYLIDKPFTFGE